VSFIDSLTEKPWLPTDPGDAPIVARAESRYRQSRTALKFFLAVVTVIFSLFIITFLERSQFPDFQALSGQAWQPLTNALPLWINTGVLLLSCIALEFALRAAQTHNFKGIVFALTIAVILAVQFIFAQLQVWKLLNDLGYYIASNPANSYFYLFTAMHGLHVLGGLVALTRLSTGVIRLSENQEKSAWESVQKRLSLCATYWHYLFVLWLLLFALLTSSADTYQMLAALCGF
jgi:cytochrome c oxidase subunit 3